MSFEDTLNWMQHATATEPREMTPEEADAVTLRALGLSRPKGK